MKNLLYGTLSALAVCLGACVVLITQGTLSLLDESRAVEHQVAETVSGIPELVSGKLDSFQVEALKRVDTALEKIDGHLAVVEKLTVEQLGAANRSIASITEVAGAELPVLRGSLSQSVASIAGDVHEVTAPAASIARHGDEASAILLRRDALPAQILGLTAAAKVTLGETAQTMKTVRIAAPEVVDDVRGIATDVRREVDAITKPKHWWQKLGALLGISGSVVARIL